MPRSNSRFNINVVKMQQMKISSKISLYLHLSKCQTAKSDNQILCLPCSDVNEDDS